MINFSILFCILELAVLFIFDFSITTSGFIHLSEQNFSSFATPLASYFHCPIFPIADQYHVRLHTVATYILSELATKRKCEGTGLAKQQHLSPHHHHQKAFYQFLSCFFVSQKRKHNDKDHNIYVLTKNSFPLLEFISLKNLEKEKKS